MTQPPSIPRARLRVVYVDHSARLSGAELALVRMIEALGDAVDAHVILGEDGPLAGRLDAVAARVEVLQLDPAARDLARDRVTPTRFPLGGVGAAARWTARLARRLRALRPDLVHTFSLKAGITGALAGRLAHVPVVWHVNDRIAGDYLPRPAVRLVRGLLGALPSAVVANSRATRATLGPLRRPMVGVVGCAVVPGPQAPDPADAVRRVGIVGRLAPWKGHDVFLDGFARAFPSGDEEAVVVGAALFGEAEVARALAERARDLGLTGRVDFRGFRGDVGAELARLDVLVHASVIPEPFGQVIIEGMAAGVPVVAAASGGPLELVEDGVNGLLVPPSDPDALAAALHRLAADSSLRARLAAGGRRRARDFAPDRIATAILEVYDAVLAARR